MSNYTFINVSSWPPQAEFIYKERKFELVKHERIEYRKSTESSSAVAFVNSSSDCDYVNKSYQPLSYKLELFDSEGQGKTPFIRVVDFEWESRWENLSEEQKIELLIPNCEELLKMEERHIARKKG